MSRWSDDALRKGLTLAACALATPGETKQETGHFLEVDAPHGAKGGDIIEVRLPSEVGTGTISVRVPMGLRGGETFEVKV